MKIKYLLLTVVVFAFAATGVAQGVKRASDPDAIVKRLYAAQKADTGPFFQTKNRRIVDQYFRKDLADLIWRDAVEAKGEVGAISFDPLYGSQDMKITNFVIMDTGWGGDAKFGPDDQAVVQVTFKNFGKEEMVSFQFEKGRDRKWKIYDIRYPDGTLLKGVLSGSPQSGGDPVDAEQSEDSAASGELQVGRTQSVILYVGEETGDYAASCFANNSAAGRAILKVCKNGDQCEVTGEVDFNGPQCKVPGLEASLSSSGRITSVKSVKKLPPRKNDEAGPSQALTIENLVQRLSESFAARTMSSLDAERPYLRSVTIVVEHSLSGRKDRRSFKTLKAAEQWIGQNRKEANFDPKPLKKCSRGVCTFDFAGGILHNSLYLQKLTYSIVKGRPVLRAIYFLDGD